MSASLAIGSRETAARDNAASLALRPAAQLFGRPQGMTGRIIQAGHFPDVGSIPAFFVQPPVSWAWIARRSWIISR